MGQPVKGGVDFLQTYNIIGAGNKYVLHEEDYQRHAQPGNQERDGNQPVRQYWGENSIPDSALRAKVINMANEVSTKEGFGTKFREGSPTLQEVWERENP